MSVWANNSVIRRWCGYHHRSGLFSMSNRIFNNFVLMSHCWYSSTTITTTTIHDVDDVDHNEKVTSEESKSHVLWDNHNRFHNYLRVSLTEKCNLRCTYCMPEEGISLTPNDELLTSDEVVRVIGVFVAAGVTKVRFTGGEPTVRRDLADIIERVGALPSLETIAMTTNGIVLSRRLPQLIAAGLNALNISLDTLDPMKFQIMTRRAGHSRVLDVIEQVLSSGVRPLKVNVVVMRGVNDDEIIDFVEFTRDRDLEVRFIEYMPFDGNKWSSNKLVSYVEMVDRIKSKYSEFCRDIDLPNDTSKAWRVPGFDGRVGFVTSMSENFCGSCNRLRITADGNLKVCLFGASEFSLRDIMRRQPNGCTDNELYDTISLAVNRKKARHAGMFEIANSKNRPMITIGG